MRATLEQITVPLLCVIFLLAITATAQTKEYSKPSTAGNLTPLISVQKQQLIEDSGTKVRGFWFSPAVLLESNKRVYPEKGNVSRIGYGFSLHYDFHSMPLTPETGLFFSNSSESFSSGNSIRDRVFRVPLGLIIRPLDVDVFYLGVRGGALLTYGQYNYRLYALQQSERFEKTDWGYYVGLDACVRAYSGFGIRFSPVVFRDVYQKKLGLQVLLGLRLQ